MKRIYTMMTMAIAMVVTFSLTSCGDDDYWYDWYDDDYYWGGDNDYRGDEGQGTEQDFYVAMAQMLAGQWRGDMMAYELDDRGVAIDSIYYSTDIEFQQYNDQSVSGTGTQYDFLQGATQPDMTRNFTWYIDTTNGSIYLTYKETTSDGQNYDYVMRIAYDNLNLSDRTFTGYLWSSDGYEVDDFWFDRFQESGYNAKAATRAGKTMPQKKQVKKIMFVMK